MLSRKDKRDIKNNVNEKFKNYNNVLFDAKNIVMSGEVNKACMNNEKFSSDMKDCLVRISHNDFGDISNEDNFRNVNRRRGVVKGRYDTSDGIIVISYNYRFKKVRNIEITFLWEEIY